MLALVSPRSCAYTAALRVRFMLEGGMLSHAVPVLASTLQPGLRSHLLTMALALEELWNDLEEAKALVEKETRKRLHDALTAEKSNMETETKNKM